MQPEWSCWHRGTGPWARSSWRFAVPVARAVHPSGGWGSWGCREQAGCRFSRMASCRPLFLQLVPTTEPPALPGERGGGDRGCAVPSSPDHSRILWVGSYWHGAAFFPARSPVLAVFTGFDVPEKAGSDREARERSVFTSQCFCWVPGETRRLHLNEYVF